MILDIDVCIGSYGSGNFANYLKKLKSATISELQCLKKAVKKHRSRPQKHRFSAIILPQGICKFSIHNEILIPAINYELSKRGRLKNLFWKIRKLLKSYYCSIWLGADLIDDIDIGYGIAYRQNGKNLLRFLGLKRCIALIALEMWNYFKKHHWQIITAAIAIYGIAKGQDIISYIYNCSKAVDLPTIT
jgi:hypothetical protein